MIKKGTSAIQQVLTDSLKLLCLFEFWEASGKTTAINSFLNENPSDEHANNQTQNVLGTIDLIAKRAAAIQGELSV